MPFINSLATISDKDDLSSLDSDTGSSASLQTQDGSIGRATPSPQQQAPPSQGRSYDPETVLGLTDDILAIAKGLYALADAKYAEEELLEVPPAGDEFEAVDCLDDARSLHSVATAKKKLEDLKSRLRIAKAQAVVAENRLRTAQAQVALAEDRVNFAVDQLESALGK
jgi:hypothetical protein